MKAEIFINEVLDGIYVKYSDQSEFEFLEAVKMAEASLVRETYRVGVKEVWSRIMIDGKEFRGELKK